jgi:hypothetical protein
MNLKSSLFYNCRNHESDVIVIPFSMGTCQCDPLGGNCSLAHFTTLRSTYNHFPSCLFPSIADDTHIIGPLQLYHLHMNISKSNVMR